MCYELKRIDELCRERGWSRYKLAQEMHDSASNVNNLFRRSGIPTTSTLRRICAAMNITMSAFYEKEGTTVSLTDNQLCLLKQYNRLDSRCQGLAVSYLQGLADGMAGEQKREERAETE